jgi:hypothetical protein
VWGTGDENGVGQRRPRVYRFAHIEILHGSLLPPPFIALGMGKHRTDIELFSIIVNRGDQSNLVSSNIKHREFTNSVGSWEDGAKLGEVRAARFHSGVPTGQGRLAIGKFLGEFIQTFSTRSGE